MRDFLKGWRRKCGCLTLAAACIILGGWTRSFSVGDVVRFGISGRNTTLVALASLDGAVAIVIHQIPDFPATAELTRLRWNSLPNARLDNAFVRFKWQRQCLGLRRGTNVADDGIDVWIVPYWVLALPPTVVSAWLLSQRTRPTMRKSTCGLKSA